MILVSVLFLLLIVFFIFFGHDTVFFASVAHFGVMPGTTQRATVSCSYYKLAIAKKSLCEKLANSNDFNVL
jgi:hypothetical protein